MSGPSESNRSADTRNRRQRRGLARLGRSPLRFSLCRRFPKAQNSPAGRFQSGRLEGTSWMGLPLR